MTVTAFHGRLDCCPTGYLHGGYVHDLSDCIEEPCGENGWSYDQQKLSSGPQYKTEVFRYSKGKARIIQQKIFVVFKG